MFERFTQDARSAVVDAQQVARELHSPRIDTRHLLVALVAARPGVHDTAHPGIYDTLRAVGLDPDDVAARARTAIVGDDPLDRAALASLGIDLDAVRAATDAFFGPGSLDAAQNRGPARAHLPFAPDAKKALELSLREAMRLREKSIGARHLLLGILRADSPGGRVLDGACVDAGVDLTALRTALDQAERAA